MEKRTNISAQRTNDTRAAGFTLIELVVTLVVLSILSIGVAPLVKTAVKRQREQQLREALREMRTAIDEFHRDTVGMDRINVVTPQPLPIPIDPRSRVVISDTKLFTTENPDRYPPTLEDMVKGVNVISRGGGVTDPNKPATEQNILSTKKKVYLRKIPVDPMTGEAEWELRSSYDEADAGSWGGENVFDVRSKSDDTALNGEKYSDW
jgi:general secretion pathway protein G